MAAAPLHAVAKPPLPVLRQFLARLSAWLPWRGLLAAALLAAVDQAVYVEPAADQTKEDYAVDFFMASSVAGTADVYYDMGHGFNDHDFSRHDVIAGAEFRPYGFDLPPGRLRRVRIDFLSGPGRVKIVNIRVVDRARHELRKIFGEEFKPNGQISACALYGDGVDATAPEGANDPALIATFRKPMNLADPAGPLAAYPARRAFFVFLAAATVVCGLRWWTLLAPRQTGALRERWERWTRHRPRLALWGVAILGTLASCYPVVFCGRSFVSPNVGSILLYGGLPTLPGMTSLREEDVQGADVGAMMWQHVPYSMVEHRAIFHDGEFPLWHRFNGSGTPLLGQGQSMLGDPIHYLVIAANGAAWAWDLKFVVARLLFCAGLGWLALAATRRWGIAAVITVAGAFVGYFQYRINHPGIITVCYAPWILVTWAELVASSNQRQEIGWVAGIAASSIVVFGSGTVKEATVLVVTLNLAGFIFLLAAGSPWREKRQRLMLVGAGGLLAALISAPLWLILRDTLLAGQTFSDHPAVIRLRWSSLLGFFDDVFYEEASPGHSVVAPSVNFLFLAGILWYAVSPAMWRQSRFAAISVLGALGSLALAFDVLPDAWILAIPRLNQIGHLSNTFSCAAMILLAAPAAVGLARAWDRFSSSAIIAEAFLVLMLALGLALLFFSHNDSWWRGTAENAGMVAALHTHAYFVRSCVLMLGAWVLLAVVARFHGRQGQWTAALVLLTLAAGLPLLGRHGQRIYQAYDKYFFRPMARVDFSARSPAIDWMKASTADAFRAFGVGINLFPGFSGVYGVESLNGPDAVWSREYRDLALAAGIGDSGDWRFRSDPGTIRAHRRVFDLLNTKYYVDGRGATSPDASLERAQELDLTIFASSTAWPRAFFVDRVGSYDRVEEFVQLVQSGDGRPFVVARAPEAPALAGIPTDQTTRTIVPATDYRLTANRTSFRVRAPHAGLVALTETAWPGDFRATLNGQPVPWIRINHAFKAVRVPAAGEFEIAFTYWPKHLTLAVWLMAGGLAGFVALAAVRGRKAAQRAVPGPDLPPSLPASTPGQIAGANPGEHPTT